MAIEEGEGEAVEGLAYEIFQLLLDERPAAAELLENEGQIVVHLIDVRVIVDLREEVIQQDHHDVEHHVRERTWGSTKVGPRKLR